jgi:hypothetical protein
VGAGHEEIRRAAAEAAEQFRPAPDQDLGNVAVEEPITTLPDPFSGETRSGDHHPYCMVDDRFDFGMQGYLDVAQGMLIDPPPMGVLSGNGGDDDDGGEVRLWSY